MGEVKYLELHGDRVAYQEAGAGEALLLIHGMAGSSATWRAVLPQLSKKYRVVAPDLFGHGESAKPRGDYSLGAFAVSLRDLLDELGITRATVVGQSLGGGVAIQFTYQHRDYCERLALISSGGLGPDLSWILRILSAPGAELVLPVVAPRPVVNVANKLGSWLTSAGIHSPHAGELWNLRDLAGPQELILEIDEVLRGTQCSLVGLEDAELAARREVIGAFGDGAQQLCCHVPGRRRHNGHRQHLPGASCQRCRK